jgi:hypothetical protein
VSPAGEARRVSGPTASALSRLTASALSRLTASALSRLTASALSMLESAEGMTVAVAVTYGTFPPMVDSHARPAPDHEVIVGDQVWLDG